ncbi:MAG: tetratricopeptide repeat protein, partial [Muribaculaceae bacterium]|nr:tetratricopeptide repeat protein [Muribaculaceae bacterium]
MKLLLSLAAALTALTATAGNTSGITDGYLDRGLFYYRSGWTGPAVDQLSHYESIADPTEESELALALAAARDADPRAIDLLERFMARYPQSTSRHMVAVVTGNCYMDRGEWAEACRWYSSVGDDSLDPDTDAARRLQTGIAMMMLGRRDEAERILARLDGTSQESNALFYRGYIAYVDRDYPRAMTLLERVTSTAMPAAMAQYYLCQMYYLDGDNNRALTRARRLTENTDVPQEYRAEASRIA